MNALNIVRVLTYQGKNADAPEDLKPHLEQISKRYAELKRKSHDFMSAAQLAKKEWLESIEMTHES